MPFTAFSRPEFIADIDVTGTNRELTLPTQGGLIPSDRFLAGLFLQYEGRFTNAAANNPTGRQADAPFSILDYIKVEGFHRLRRQKELFCDVRAADMRQAVSLYTQHSPHTTHASGDLSIAASGTNDVRFIIFLPFYPLALPLRQRINWLLDAPNYDSLTLKIRNGDDKSVFTGQTTASTFSAFGSATGNPRIRVTGLFAMGGASRFAGFVPGRVWRYYREITGSVMTTTATGQRIFEIPRGERIRALLLKTGTIVASGQTAPNVAYTTLSDAILANIKVNRGLNREIRNQTDFHIIREEIATAFGRVSDTGYALLDWAKEGTDGESLDTRDLIAGTTGDVDTFVKADVTGAANQAALMLIEELRGGAARAAIPMRRR